MESCQVKRSDGLELNVKPPACSTSSNFIEEVHDCAACETTTFYGCFLYYSHIFLILRVMMVLCIETRNMLFTVYEPHASVKGWRPTNHLQGRCCLGWYNDVATAVNTFLPVVLHFITFHQPFMQWYFIHDGFHSVASSWASGRKVSPW